jgi:hypothetical protein
MRNISDNELDKLFQDAAQRIEPEFDPGDWDKLSKRIDRSDRINLFKRIAIYLSLALLLIFSTWLGINYYRGQSDSKNNAVNNSDAGIEKEIPDYAAAGETRNSTDTNASAEYAGIDAGEDNGTPAGSSSEGATAVSRDSQNGQTSSAGDQASLSAGNNTDTQKTKDIAAADQNRAIASTSATQSAVQNTAERKNTSSKSTSTAENNSTAAGTKDQNGNAIIHKSAERTATDNDQQRIQKQKRAVAGEKKKRDEGSLSASGNSENNGSQKDLALTSESQQKTSAIEKDAKSSLTSVQAEKSSKQAGNTASSNETTTGNNQKNENIASDTQRLSSASITTTSGEKQNAANTKSNALTGTNTGADVMNNSAIQNDGTAAVATNQSNTSDQAKANSNTLSSQLKNKEASASGTSDTLALTDTRAKSKNSAMLNDHNATSGNTTANQAGNANQNIAGADSLSTVTPVLKSNDNISSVAKGVVEKSTDRENATGVVANDRPVEKSTSKEDSLQGSAPALANVYNENKGISAADSTVANRNRTNEGNRDTRKTATGGIENASTQPASKIDRASASDSLSRNEADSKPKVIDNAAPAKDGNTAKGDEAFAKLTDDNAGREKQTISSSTGTSIDSLSNHPESAIRKAREKSNAVTVNDSTLAKPITKADSLNHAAENENAAEDKREEEKKSNESNWYVKLLVSPDFSSIGYNKPGKTGFNFGLTVEYSPAKHWGFSTGAIWSKKLYDKNNPGKSYSYGGTSFEADYLDGDCRVLDIPINITYYILPEARLNFYATVGVSSYIMLKEDYVYTVTENNNNYYYYEDYKNENRHWFAMLNISFGLQYRISPRLQLQAEPFLKAPMSGVGQGKIDLVSAGSFFTLKYKLK